MYDMSIVIFYIPYEPKLTAVIYTLNMCLFHSAWYSAAYRAVYVTSFSVHVHFYGSHVGVLQDGEGVAYDTPIIVFFNLQVKTEKYFVKVNSSTLFMRCLLIKSGNG